MSTLDSETILACLFDSTSRHPGKVALRCGEAWLTYDEFRSRILSAAARLRSLGVGRGHRVLLSGRNGLPVPIAYFAIHSLGAVAVPVPAETIGAAMARLAGHCEARLAVLEQAPAEMPCPVEDLARLSDRGNGSVEPICRRTEVADILYTTGTTGRKKGVILTHSNVFAAARNMTAVIRTTVDDVELVPLPLAHSFGLGRLRTLALVGHTLILEPSLGIGAGVIKTLVESRATGLSMVPAGFEILHRVARDAIGRIRDHLRYVEIGSAPMRPQTRSWLMETLPGTRLCHHYGLTEASRAAFTEYHADRDRMHTAGRAAPNVTITICDAVGNPLAAGQMGEVVVAGDVVTSGYYGDPCLNREAFCARGLRTGDLGYIDPDGYLFLQGRLTDLINVGGRKVVPEEVEHHLRLMDGVRDVACVGVPNPLMGEHVKAYIISDRLIHLKSVAAFLRSRIEEYKVPRSIELVENLPRTSSGKLQRVLLRSVAQPLGPGPEGPAGAVVGPGSQDKTDESARPGSQAGVVMDGARRECEGGMTWPRER